MSSRTTTLRDQIILTPKQPAFRSRKTIADYVRERMAAKKRKSYYHKIVLLTEHKNYTKDFIPKFKEEIDRIRIIVEDNILSEKITGMVFYYQQYSALMFAGSEECITRFINELIKIENQFFTKVLVLLYMKNINKVYFDKIVWKTGDPPIILEAFSEMGIETIKKQHNIVIKQLFDLWAQVSEDLNSGELSYTKDWLTTTYSQNMLVLTRIEYVMNSKGLYELQDMYPLFNYIPPVYSYDENIWPVPDDFIPRNIIDLGPYDINLLFPNWQS